MMFVCAGEQTASGNLAMMADVNLMTSTGESPAHAYSEP